MTSQAAFFKSPRQCTDMIRLTLMNLRSTPELRFRIILKIANDFRFLLCCGVGRIAGIGRWKSQQILGELFTNTVKYTAGYKRCGHGFGDEFVRTDSFFHLRAHMLTNIVANRSVKCDPQPGLLVGHFFNMLIGPVSRLQQNKAQKSNPQQPQHDQHSCHLSLTSF